MLSAFPQRMAMIFPFEPARSPPNQVGHHFARKIHNFNRMTGINLRVRRRHLVLNQGDITSREDQLWIMNARRVLEHTIETVVLSGRESPRPYPLLLTVDIGRGQSRWFRGEAHFIGMKLASTLGSP